MNDKEKIIYDAIGFGVFIIVLASLLFWLAVGARSSWQDGLCSVINETLSSSEKYNEYKAENFVTVQSPFALSCAVFSVKKIDDLANANGANALQGANLQGAENLDGANVLQSAPYAVVVRAATTFGFAPLVFFFDEEYNGDFVGVAKLSKKSIYLNQNLLPSGTINFWQERLKRVLPKIDENAQNLKGDA